VSYARRRVKVGVFEDFVELEITNKNKFLFVRLLEKKEV